MLAALELASVPLGFNHPTAVAVIGIAEVTSPPESTGMTVVKVPEVPVSTTVLVKIPGPRFVDTIDVVCPWSFVLLKEVLKGSDRVEVWMTEEFADNDDGLLSDECENRDEGEDKLIAEKEKPEEAPDVILEPLWLVAFKLLLVGAVPRMVGGVNDDGIEDGALLGFVRVEFVRFEGKAETELADLELWELVPTIPVPNVVMWDPIEPPTVFTPITSQYHI